MMKRTTLKEISESLHTYGKVSWVGGRSGKQFVLPFGKGTDGFQFILFGYGLKSEVSRKFAEVLNTCSDEEISQLPFVQCNKKIPLTLRSATGLNCF